MTRRKIPYLIIGLFMAGLSSCRKLLTVPSPQNQLTATTVYSSDASAEEALAGMYTQIMLGSRSLSLLNGGMSLFGGLSSDELTYTTPNPQTDLFQANQLTATYASCSYLYTNGYLVIFSANSILAGIAASSGMSAGEKTELRGEAEFVRALEYFYLANLYGGVPLVTSTNFAVSATQPRDSVANVYTQIIADLEDAKQLLPTDYITTPAFPGGRVRPNRLAAMALLARVYLYRRQWAQAEQEADTVINSGLYLLEPDLDSVFLSTSHEAIWQLQPVNTSLTTEEAATFIPRAGSRPAYVLTGFWLGGVEANDRRRVAWTDSVVSNNVVYVYPYKYKLVAPSTVDTEYDMVLRLAEQYLIRAEAQAQEGNLAGAAADLNAVRARAGLPPTTADDQLSLLTAILQERRIEFFGEFGHRWLDLKRMGLATAVLGSVKPGWVDTDTLYPIPATEIIANPRLIQNPGY